MNIETIFQSRWATTVLLAAALAAATASRAAMGEQPISLNQPTTTLILTAVNEESVVASPTRATTTARVQAPATRAAQPAAPFTPHYLCLCPPYCPKPMPCVDCCYKCCPDCYCPKPMPCPNPCYNCTCDDYCAKPMPCRFPQPLCGPCAPCRQTVPPPWYAPFPPRGPLARP